MATFTFTGAVNNDFFTAGNWDLGVVPNEDKDVVIPAGKVCNGANDFNYFSVAGTLNVDSFYPNYLGVVVGGIINIVFTFSPISPAAISGTINLAGEDANVTNCTFLAGGALNLTSSAKIFSLVEIQAGATANLSSSYIILSDGELLVIGGTVSLRDESIIYSGSSINLQSGGILSLENSIYQGGPLTGAGIIKYDLPSMRQIVGTYGANYKYPRNWKGGVL